MFTKNFDAMRQLSLYGVNTQIGVQATNTSGVSHDSMYAQYSNCALGFIDTNKDYNTFEWAYVGVCLWIGSGNAEESELDIALAEDPTKAVSADNPSTSLIAGTHISKGAYTVAPAYENGIAKVRYDRTFTALTDITVGEVVLCKGIQTGKTAGTAEQFMFYRKKLDTPMSYSAGTTFTISMIVGPQIA